MPRAVPRLDGVICAECVRRLSTLGGDVLAQEVTTPAAVPLALSDTHALCRACASLHRIAENHEARCALGAAQVELTVAGWASGISEGLRIDLRRARPTGFGVTLALAVSLGDKALARVGADRASAVIVSVPTGGRGATDPLVHLAAAMAERLGATFADGALRREKRESTREVVSQARARIARTEYTVVDDRVARVSGRNVLLLDDTVTTGHTLARLSLMLLRAGASAVLPLALDRTASPRLLQRADARAPDRCPHVEAQGADF